MKKLNAENLKNELWKTLLGVRGGDIDASVANSIAGQARGIISTINAEIQIQHSKIKLSSELRGFTGNATKE